MWKLNTFLPTFTFTLVSLTYYQSYLDVYDG